MNKRQQVLDTTLELISELGFQATPISLITKKSNVAAGTIYHYFKNKEDLIDTLYFDIKKEMGIAIEEGIHSTATLKDKFFMIWKNLFNYYMKNPKKFEYLENYANSPFIHKEIKQITRRYYQNVINFFESGIQLGMFRNLPIDLLINLIFSNVSSFVRMIIMEEIEFSEALLGQVIQSSWDSVKIT